MKFIKVVDRTVRCKNCGCQHGPDKKFIKLNTDGVQFLGFMDLLEYILVRYKLTWTLIAAPIVGLLIGLKLG